jgi:integrase
MDARGKAKKTAEPWTYLKREEIPRVLAAMGDNPERFIVQFAVGTGVRLEEQWNIHLVDVEAYGEDPHVRIRYGGSEPSRPGKALPEGAVMSPHGRVLLPCKNGKVRRVPLFGLALDAVREWLKILREYAPDNPHGLLFPRPKGTYAGNDYHPPVWEVPQLQARRKTLEESGVPNATRPALSGAGITRLVRWHDLRHTFGTAAVNGFLCGDHK